MHTLQTSDMRIEIFGSTTRYKGSTGADRAYPRRSQTDTTPPERYQRLMSSLHGPGSARLRVGTFNTYPDPTNVVQWFDAADGRYLETRAGNITLRPAAPQDFSTRFATWLDNALGRLREDEYERW